MERDFGQAAGMRAEDALKQLDRLQASIDAGRPDYGWRVLLPALRRYYDHYAGLARGYTKDPEQSCGPSSRRSPRCAPRSSDSKACSRITR